MSKHTNYKFPSSELKEFGFTSIERKYLGRRKKNTVDHLLLTLLVIAFLFLAYAIYTNVEVFSRAEAAEIKGNTDYCREVMEGKWTVIGATPAEVATYCGV